VDANPKGSCKNLEERAHPSSPLGGLRNNLFCEDDPMPAIMTRLARQAEDADPAG